VVTSTNSEMIKESYRGVFIGLGSNLGDRLKNLQDACFSLESHSAVRVVHRSSVYETTPVGGPQQGDYLNAVVELETSLSAPLLLALLQQIEDDAGRTRDIRWGARTLDLDLLLFGDSLIDSPDLTVPHPRLAERFFVLVPLADMAPDTVVPIVDKRAHQLLAALGRPQGVTHFCANW